MTGGTIDDVLARHPRLGEVTDRGDSIIEKFSVLPCSAWPSNRCRPGGRRACQSCPSDESMTSTHEPPVSRTGSTGLRACVLFASFFLLAGAGLLYGKPISIDIASPPPEQVDFKHLWGITLHNPTSDTVSVSLRVEAREVAAGVVFTTSTQKIVLAPGDHRLAPRDVKLTDEWWKKGYEAFTRPGHLPEGDFTYTVSLVPAMMQAALFFRIRIPKPVELIWPSNAAVVGDSQPVFAWKPPVVSGPPGAYRYFLRVVEVARGQNAAAALQRNPSVFDGRGLSATVCRIPVQAGRFVPGKTYAWRAAAMDPARESVDTTRTRSQASLFLYRPDMAKADTTTAFAYQPAGNISHRKRVAGGNIRRPGSRVVPDGVFTR